MEDVESDEKLFLVKTLKNGFVNQSIIPLFEKLENSTST